MTLTRFATGLLLGTALILTGCGDTSSTKTDSKPIETQTVQDMTKRQARASQAIAYTEAGKTDDDHLWLEEVEGEAALNQVKAWNAASEGHLKSGPYQNIFDDLLAIYNSPEKIPYVSIYNREAHNFWQDETNTKGIWRKSSLDNYIAGNPTWETVLDIDALAAKEGKNWVYKGRSCLEPLNQRCIISLSDGGKDAVVRREFNVKQGRFAKAGFNLPESKGSTSWLDVDHMVVGIDFGDGTMTDSGYPMIAKLWKRGTPISEARELMRGEKTDVGVWPGTIENADGETEIMIARAKTFYTSEYFWIPQSGPNAFEPVKLPIPEKSSPSGQYKNQVLLSLREDWRGFETGTLVSFGIDDFMADGKIDEVFEVFKPGPRQSIGNFGVTRHALVMSISDNVARDAYVFRFRDGKWIKRKLDFPANGTISIGATHEKSEVAFVNTEGFLEPDTLWALDTKSMETTKVNALPSWFDSSNMVADQKFVKSTDGTEIPYFIIHKKDIELDGTNPTILYGYGGFQISMNPSYSGTLGKAWLERGGVYVLSNIRGGGEFGPKWHQAGLKTKRQIIYDDFISIAEDLIADKVTSPQHLGIHGGSNGGLLMGVMMTQRPDLFNAVAIGVPLLDMKRYDKLLAGASWVGEYGDPDDTGAEGEFIRNLSPYHNIVAGADYPVPLIYTSTKDDRVHPGHARKYAQRLADHGYKFYYYENIDGGHSAAANLKESANNQAMIYTYFDKALR